jgi:hypothetical protein
MRKKTVRMTALLLTLALALSLSSSLHQPIRADDSDGAWRLVLDDAITYPDPALAPIVRDGVVYLPVELVLAPLGADYQIDELSRTLSLYRGEQIVAINLLNSQAITSDGRFLSTEAFYSNPTYYVQASFAAGEFGGKLTRLSNGIYRITTGSQALSDDEMVLLMKSMPSFSPRIVDQPTVYLLFHGAGAGLSKTLSLLSQHGISATFFFSANDIAQNPGALRRVYIAGHRIGIYAPQGKVQEVTRANDLVQKVLKLRTGLVYAPSNTTALQNAGYQVWNASLLSSAQQGELSLTRILSTVGWTTSVWFDGSASSAEVLAAILNAIESMRLKTAIETASPFHF